ncbi:MAG TPA: FkbM family methyltransferase [Ignavibacteria bacterium]
MLKILRKTKNIIVSSDLFKRIVKNFIGGINFKIKIKVNNKKFIIPIIKNIGLSNLTLDEIWFPDLISKLLTLRNGVFIDIGANTGQTLLALRSVNSDTVYYGFEPNPSCVFYCLNLIKSNKIKNSFVIPVGIFSENKILNIHLFSDADSGGTIIEDLRPGYPINEKYFIPVMNFNDVQKTLNLTGVSVIKIDVEGSELKVINSLENIIYEFKPVIICEILWAHNEEKLLYNRENNMKILEIMKSLEYKVFRLIKSDKNDKILSLEHIEEIENFVYSRENMELCDYIMIHKDVEIKVINIINN